MNSFALLAFVGTLWTLCAFPLTETCVEFRTWRKRRSYLKRIRGKTP